MLDHWWIPALILLLSFVLVIFVFFGSWPWEGRVRRADPRSHYMPQGGFVLTDDDVNRIGLHGLDFFTNDEVDSSTGISRNNQEEDS